MDLHFVMSLPSLPLSFLVSSIFSISPNGTFCIHHSLNYEEQSFYEVMVYASSPSIRIPTPLVISVTVLDVNETPLLMDEHLSLSEEAFEEQWSHALTVIDEDRNQLHSFSLLGCSEMSCPFALHANGTLFLTRALDYAQCDFYLLNVTVCDSGVPSLCASGAVSISIRETLKLPTCYPEIYHVEEHRRGVVLSPPYHAVSNHMLVYSVVNSSLLFIHPVSGSIHLLSELDYEQTPDHQVSVTVRAAVHGNASLFCEASIVVVIHDVNEPPVLLDSPLDDVTVNETLPLGSVIGGPIRFRDPDLDDAHSFSLQCIDSSLTCPFAISSSGVIQLHSTDFFAYRLKPQWVLRVRVTDAGGLFDEDVMVVHLTHVNHAPFFANRVLYRVGQYPVRLFDNVGYPVTAVDPDDDELTYSLAEESFSIDALGQIRVHHSNLNPFLSYSLHVTVSDPYNLTDSVLVVVTFNTTGSQSLSLHDASYTVAETAPVGIALLPLLSVSGVFTPPLLFEMVNPGATPVFAVDNSTGVISLQQPVDYEAVSLYTFSVLVTDAFGQQDAANVTVHVVDVNEPPVLDAYSCVARRSVVEGAEANTFLYPALEANDPDEYDAVTYSVEPLYEGEPLPFQITPMGLLFVSNSSLLDYALHRSFVFRVVASDQHQLADSCVVRVDVTRRNHPPALKWIEDPITISEATTPGSVIPIQSFVEDEDESLLQYSIEDVTATKNESYAFPFVSAGNASDVVLTQPLNASLQNTYRIRVCVHDHELLSDCRALTISVLPINRPPLFVNPTMTLTVREDLPVGSRVTTVVAVDSEGSPILYALTGSADFSIDTSTGDVTTVRPLDYEREKEYNLTVTAFDLFGGSEQTSLFIRVEDVNEPPVCLDSPDHTVFVDDRAEVGVFVTRVNASDPEVLAGEQSLLFAFAESVSDFSIASNGTITVASPLDFWRQSQYLLMISVQDDGSSALSTLCSVVIRVVDHNDPPVLHLNASVIHVPEDILTYTPIPLDIAVSDRDAGQEHEFFVNHTSVFGINPHTGELFCKSTLDYEELSVYYVVIGVREKGESPLTDFAILTILLDDVNEPPSFLQNELAIREDTAVNTTIGVVHYADEDYGVNGTVECVQNSHFAVFQIERQSCGIKLVASLDYEAVTEYVVQVTLRDGGGLEMVGTVHILIIDVNEPPLIAALPSSILVAISTPIGTPIGSPFLVTDPEEDELTVHTEPVNVPFEVVAVSEDRYSLVVKDALEAAAFPMTLHVIACDDALCTNATVIVEALSDTPVVPVVNPITCSVVEHTPIHTVLENCTLQLQNAELFSSVSFEQHFTLVSSDFVFVPLNATTAQVKVVEDVDYETVPVYVLPFAATAISAKDNSTSSVLSVLTIEVVDVNEAPVFDAEPSVLYVEENAPQNRLLSPCLHATDPDASDVGQPLQFSMTTVNEWFGVQSASGCLFVKKSGLDFEDATQPKTWSLRVTVSDVHGASSTRSVSVVLVDVNEPPAFAHSASYFALITPVLPNTVVGYELSVSDPDANAVLAFSIEQQSCAGMFSLSPTRPLLYTSGEVLPNPEGRNRTCVVHVLATDEGGLTDSTLVYVTFVSNVSPPTIISSSITVAENPSLHQVVHQLEAQSNCADASNRFQFVLLPSPYASSLTIDSANRLLVNDPAVFDYEQLQQFDVTVMAIDLDCFNVSSTKTLTVLVSDVNEPPVVSDAVYHVYPGMTYPLTLSPPIAASDPEGSPVLFSFTSSHANVTVNNAGVVTLLGDLAASIALPSESETAVSTHAFSFSMLATDNGVPPLSSAFTLTIEVDKLHLNVPSFTPSFVEGSSTRRFVHEDAAVGAVVGPSLAVDTESVRNPTLFFSLASCSPYCPVVINSVSGALVLSKPLDFERVPSYALNVTVTNGFASDWIEVRLVVLDVSDCAIEALSPAYLDVMGDRVVFRGSNLSPVGVGNASGLEGVLVTGDAFTMSFTAHYSVLDAASSVMTEGVLTNCQILAYGSAVACSMPPAMGAVAEFQVSWLSSVANATQHVCSFAANAIEFEHVVVEAVSGALPMNTSGGTVCFEGRNMGSRVLYNSVPNRNAIAASASFVDASTRPLSACAYNNYNHICCSLDSGYGSSVEWELCLYGWCSRLEAGSFVAPAITSVSADAALSCEGGEFITLRGSNFGASISVVRVFMEDDLGQKELRDCRFSVLHTVLRCVSAGVGDHLLFTVHVGDQASPPFVSSLAYDAPVITSVYGPGTTNALTSGGQVVYVAGRNLGADDFNTHLAYGHNNSFLFTTPSCHLVLPHTLVRCITVPGSGFQNQWQITVGVQTSGVFSQTQSIYGAPQVTAVAPSDTPLPTQGGLNVTIQGANFGSDASLLSVRYTNEEGDVYDPLCWLSVNHTEMVCRSVAGHGTVKWSVEVDGLRSEDLFTMAYTTPVVDQILCKHTGCGSTRGGDVLLLRGDHFDVDSSVLAYYGFSSEFAARDCRVVSTRLIECTTAPGVGQFLTWTVYVGSQKAQCASTLVFSYNATVIQSAQTPVALKGGEEVFLTVSNDFTLCPKCSFLMLFNAVAVEAGVVNSTTLSAYAPTLSSSTLAVAVVVRFKQITAETTNEVSIPLQSPFIASYMISAIAQSGAPSYLLSLFGSNFGYVQRDVSIRIQRTQRQSETVSCLVQKVSDDYASCTTSFTEGSVTLVRHGSASNTVQFALQSTHFELSDFETSIDGYLVYPQRFHTRGGDLLHVRGTDIPEGVDVVFGSLPCPLSAVNRTFLSCVVPPGEGLLIPVRVQLRQQMLLQVFASYFAPSVQSLSPSSLQFDTTALTLTGDDFGFHPTVVISGVSSGAVECNVTSHAHASIQCELASVDSIGMVLQVVTAGQSSNSVTLSVAPPVIVAVSVFGANEESLEGVPTAGEGTVLLHGENLNADSTRCLLNGASMQILRKNATDLLCRLVESVDATASFSVTAGLRSSNTLSLPFLPPSIDGLLPSQGSTAGGDMVEVTGTNLGCSPALGSSHVSVHFGSVHLSSEQILACDHHSIRFLTPEGQGVSLPVSVHRHNQTSETLFFSYASPVIESIEAELVVSQRDVPVEQYVFSLRGTNFGSRDAAVFVSEQECALVQHNHTFVSCLAPLFVGGNRSVFLSVSGQRSNAVFFLFPSPEIERVEPLLVASTGAILRLYGTHIPPVSSAALLLTVAQTPVLSCHFASSSSPFVECHLPELPRGRLPLQLRIGDETISIPLPFRFLTVVCPQGSYASDGELCIACPAGSTCPVNATQPIAGPGEWTEPTDSGKHTVDKCFNPSACLGGNQCRAGYHAYKCSQCDVGFSRYNTWTCQKCPMGVRKLLPVATWILVCVVLYLASLSHYSAHFVWFSVFVDVVQCLGVLSLFRPRFSPVVAPILDFCSLFVLDTDLFRLECSLPGVKPTTLWFLSLLVIATCLVVDVCVRVVYRCVKQKRVDLGSYLTQFTSLMYVLFAPLVFQSLQSLSCNNKHYIAQNAAQLARASMCWKQADYRWVLVVSVALLLFALVTAGVSFAFARRDRAIDAAEGSSAAVQLIRNQYSKRIHLLFQGFTDHSLHGFYVVFALKTLLVLVLVLLRNEIHLQGVMVVLLLVTLLLCLLFKPPFASTRRYTERVLSCNSLSERKSSPASEAKNDAFVLSVTTQKRLAFSPNTLALFGVVLFALCYVDIMMSASLSVWRRIGEGVIDLLFSLFVVEVVVAGCGEVYSLVTRKPNRFFERIIVDASSTPSETVFVNADVGSENRDTLSRLQTCLKRNIVIPSVSQSGDVSDDLLQLSLSEVLRNNVNHQEDASQHGRDSNQQGRSMNHAAGSEEAQRETTDMQQLARLFEKVMEGKE